MFNKTERSQAFLLRAEKGRNSLEIIELPILAEFERLENPNYIYSFQSPFDVGGFLVNDYYTRIHLF